MSNPYESFEKSELVLRDRLALDRTRLANQRTFLAYIRTSIAIFVGGASIIHFYDSKYLLILGVIILLSGIVTLFLGIRTFLVSRKNLSI